MANRSIALLSAMYSWVGRLGLVSDDFNPTRRVYKFRESRRERLLSREEFARLGATLREAETVGIPYEVDEGRPTAKHAPKPENRRVLVAPDAVAAILLLLLTGCRLREILNLQWTEVDFERNLLLLRDSKTGPKTVIIGDAATMVLAELPKVSQFVFPGATGEKPRSDLKRPWSTICRRAKLNYFRLHDLRHSFASVGVGAGLGLPILGKLLGHTQPSTTARYAHLADDPLRQAMEKISESISAAMMSNVKAVDSRRA
jgi:integrase